jgi:hypothetical protein
MFGRRASPRRTGLQSKFPVNRENNREIRGIDSLGPKIGENFDSKSRLLASNSLCN